MPPSNIGRGCWTKLFRIVGCLYWSLDPWNIVNPKVNIFTTHTEILLLLQWFLLPILVPLHCVGSLCTVRFKAEVALRLLSIDAIRLRYFHIFLHIYRTLVAGSESSAWNGRCQRIYLYETVPRPTNCTRLVTAALNITCVVSPLTEPQTYSVSFQSASASASRP